MLLNLIGERMRLFPKACPVQLSTASSIRLRTLRKRMRSTARVYKNPAFGTHAFQAQLLNTTKLYASDDVTLYYTSFVNLPEWPCSYIIVCRALVEAING
jgi:hypothetical protein